MMDKDIENFQNEEKKPNEVKLKSEMYNHDNEKIIKREENASDAMMWGAVIGFVLFFILLIIIIVFIN